MEIYRVGGAVRDALLGLPVRDQDWVVVGATPEELMLQGYLPVGKDFPVFLHPQTREEYALARTERKTARGYRGFAVHAAPDVTLEQDLARRDLTINAIAEDPATGALVDPFGGQRRDQQVVEQRILALDQQPRTQRDDPLALAGGRGIDMVRVADFTQFGHPHLEELVEIARDDRQETQAFEQRHIGRFGLRQHPLVECQHALFAVQQTRTRLGRRTDRLGIIHRAKSASPR